MTNDVIQDIVLLDWTQKNSTIKVIGVGGGGCNAVNYMFGQNIQGCSFIVTIRRKQPSGFHSSN